MSPLTDMLLQLYKASSGGAQPLTRNPCVHDTVRWGITCHCRESSTLAPTNNPSLQDQVLDGCRGLLCVWNHHVPLIGLLCRARCRWPQGQLHWGPQAAEGPSTHRPYHWQGPAHQRGDCSGSAGESCGAATDVTWCLLALPCDILPAVDRQSGTHLTQRHAASACSHARQAQKAWSFYGRHAQCSASCATAANWRHLAERCMSWTCQQPDLELLHPETRDSRWCF